MNYFVLSILLQLSAMIVVIAEIFIPSGGILGAIALGLFSYSLFVLFSNVSAMAGSIAFCLDIILVPLIIYLGFKRLSKSNLSLNLCLSSTNGFVSQSEEFQTLIEQKGIATSDLRPSGCADINGLRVDVVTRGEYIEQNTPIEVVSVTGNQVVVRSC
jgi:membrane-bound serine protease (ClpP class)